jgi:hypothetical protein
MNRWITAAVLIAVWACLTAVLDAPTESPEAISALDLQDAINTARVAAKD